MVYWGHYNTNPNNPLLQGKSLKITNICIVWYLQNGSHLMTPGLLGWNTLFTDLLWILLWFAMVVLWFTEGCRILLYGLLWIYITSTSRVRAADSIGISVIRIWALRVACVRLVASLARKSETGNSSRRSNLTEPVSWTGCKVKAVGTVRPAPPIRWRASDTVEIETTQRHPDFWQEGRQSHRSHQSLQQSYNLGQSATSQGSTFRRQWEMCLPRGELLYPAHHESCCPWTVLHTTGADPSKIRYGSWTDGYSIWLRERPVASMKTLTNAPRKLWPILLGCSWYLGSMDYFTPIKVGWIRPVNRWNNPTY